MQPDEQAILLRIFIGERDHHAGHPLYEAIVLKAREMGLAGATVLRSPMGFGATSRLHTTKVLQLSTDLPMVIEIIDTEERIAPFRAVLDAMMAGGLVTEERVTIRRYTPHPPATPHPAPPHPTPPADAP